MILIGFTVIAIVFSVSLIGWGSLANRFTRSPTQNPVVLLVAGLGTLVFLGGVLNLLHNAYGWAFDGLTLGGVALAVCLYTFRPLFPRTKDEWAYVAIAGLVIALIMSFTIATQLPPKAYNWHDDYEKYFAFPVRMLRTGTLFGSPLSAIGVETLGGQAVLHGLILNHFPIAYLNGADAVFGLFLCLLLIVSSVPRRLGFLPVSLAGLLMVISIEPMQTNISALYSGSAFMMASILLFSPSEGYENGMRRPVSPLLTSLIYAALLSLKPTFLLFPVFQVMFYCLALALSGVQFRQVLQWSVSTVCLTLLFLSPWLLLHLPHYLLYQVGKPILNAIPPYDRDKLNLFSANPESLGNFGLFTLVAAAAALAPCAMYLEKFTKHKPFNVHLRAGIAGSGVAVAVAYLFILLLGPTVHRAQQLLRYSIPYLIAGAPAILTLSQIWIFKRSAPRFRRSMITLLFLLEGLIIAAFSSSLVSRVDQALQSGNTLAFSNLAMNRDYLDYNKEILYGTTAARISAAQKTIPAGQPFVAWIYAPFYFDFKRNRIFDIDRAGLENPWAELPREVDYFVFEYFGPVVRLTRQYAAQLQDPVYRKNAELCLQFLRRFEELGIDADTLYDDGKIVVFKTRKKE